MEFPPLLRGWPRRSLTVKQLRKRGADLTPGALRRDLLVTGCGGSGTGWVTQLLERNELRVTHDFGLGRDGIVTNACDGRKVWLLAGDPRHLSDMLIVPVADFSQVVHLVRHPLLTIGSVHAKWHRYGSVWPHVRAVVSELSDGKVTQWGAALYWLRWNQLTESCAMATFRFEQLLEDPSDLFALVGRRYKKTPDRNQRVLPSDTTWYPSWSELRSIDSGLTMQIRELAERYGYVDDRLFWRGAS